MNSSLRSCLLQRTALWFEPLRAKPAPEHPRATALGGERVVDKKGEQRPGWGGTAGRCSKRVRATRGGGRKPTRTEHCVRPTSPPRSLLPDTASRMPSIESRTCGQLDTDGESSSFSRDNGPSKLESSSRSEACPPRRGSYRVERSRSGVPKGRTASLPSPGCHPRSLPRLVTASDAMILRAPADHR